MIFWKKDKMSQKPNEISDQQTRLVIDKHLAREQRDITRGGLYTVSETKECYLLCEILLWTAEEAELTW